MILKCIRAATKKRDVSNIGPKKEKIHTLNSVFLERDIIYFNYNTTQEIAQEKD